MSKIFIVCAPSGAGKTSITRQVIAHDPKILLSLSHTTRSPRSSEKDGIDYFLFQKINSRSFRKMVCLLKRQRCTEIIMELVRSG